MVYVCSGAAGVRLVNAVQLCYFSSDYVTPNGKKLKCNKGIGAGEATVTRETLDCGVCSLLLICRGCVSTSCEAEIQQCEDGQWMEG